jgi:hypothetical protein
MFRIKTSACRTGTLASDKQTRREQSRGFSRGCFAKAGDFHTRCRVESADGGVAWLDVEPFHESCSDKRRTDVSLVLLLDLSADNLGVHWTGLCLLRLIAKSL